MALVHHDNKQMTLFAVTASMEPKDFCQKWVTNLEPGEWGYFKACVEELAFVTNLSSRTIEKWGPDFEKRPNSVLITLEKEDTLREIKKLLKVREAPSDNHQLQIQNLEVLTPKLEPLEPEEFCATWVPILGDKKPNEYGYRKECCRFLAQLTGYEEGFISKWLSQPQTVPRLVRRHLRALDGLWKLQAATSQPTQLIYPDK